MSTAKAKTIFDFEALRKKLGFSQAQMAHKMGLGSRAYFTLEQDSGAINERHIMLAQMVSLREAVAQKDYTLARPEIRRLAFAFTELADKANKLARVVEPD